MSKTKKKSRSAYDSYGYGFYNGIKSYGRYIAISSILEDLDSGAVILEIEYDTLSGERRTISIKRDLLSRKKDLQALLLKHGADAYDGSISTLMNCLRESENHATTGFCFRRTGWITDACGTADETLCFKANSLICHPDVDCEANYVGLYDLRKKGSFSAWKSLVRKWVLGSAALEVALLIGLSPIISCEWGGRNLIFHFMGDSSTGKTTSAILSVSTAGCPNPAETAKNKSAEGNLLRSLLSSWKGTSNALIGKLDGLDGTIMVFDELSKVENSDILSSTIYTLSDGADKDRMLSPTEMQSTNVIRTNILSVGEESLLEKAGSKNSGLNIRVCEISTNFTQSAEQSEAIVTGCYANYGHAVPKFVRYIVTNMTYADVSYLRQKNLADFAAGLKAKGCQSTALDRLSEFGAILLTTADIAKDALDLEFSREAITDFLIDQHLRAESNTDIGLRAHNALKDYINAHIGNFITDGSSSWDKSIPCLGKIDRPKGGPMEASILCSEFSAIMRQMGYNNPSLILQKFKFLGFLSYESGKNYRKRQLTKVGGTVRVYVVRFP